MPAPDQLWPLPQPNHRDRQLPTNPGEVIAALRGLFGPLWSVTNSTTATMHVFRLAWPQLELHRACRRSCFFAHWIVVFLPCPSRWGSDRCSAWPDTSQPCGGRRPAWSPARCCGRGRRSICGRLVPLRVGRHMTMSCWLLSSSSNNFCGVSVVSSNNRIADRREEK